MENFDTLLSRMPRVSVLALTGIAGMFIAPFGIVVAKWTAIRAFLEVPGFAGASFLIIMAFGSSLTIFYWGKLLIKILSMRSIEPYERSVEARVTRYEWFAEVVLAAGVIGVAAGLGLISDHVVGPYALSAFPAAPVVFLHLDPAMVVVMLVGVLFLPALALWSSRRSDYDLADFYTSGRSANAGHLMGAALGGTRTVTLRNYYLDGVINGALVFRTGTLVCGAVLVTAGLVALVVAR
jgi:ech hydrogenase subunit A